jgi:hypothetical protein
MAGATPDIELADERLTTFTEMQLENYICHHGPCQFTRTVLRKLVAVEHPEYPTRKIAYLFLARVLYRAGHTLTVIEALQAEGYFLYPPCEKGTD